MSEEFYVYEHLRNDTNEVFYVGKGKAGSGRIKTRNGRNQYWHNVVNKVGFTVHKKIVGIIDEELSFLIEIERISQLSELGYKLCNLTDGGEGLSNPAAVTRAKMSEVNTGENNPFHNKKHSKETLKKMSASALARPKAPTITCPHCGTEGNGGAMKQWHFDNCSMNPSALPQPTTICPHCGKEGKVNMKRYHFSNCLMNPSAPPRRPRPEVTEESKARMSAGCLAKPKVICPYCGKKGDVGNMKQWHFDNCSKNPSAPPRREVTEETRARMSEARRNMSTETRARMTVSQQKVPKVTCPYCGKEGRAGAMKRWHFDNCKKKEL